MFFYNSKWPVITACMEIAYYQADLFGRVVDVKQLTFHGLQIPFGIVFYLTVDSKISIQFDRAMIIIHPPYIQILREALI